MYFRVSNKLWPSLLFFLIFRLLGLYCSPSIYNAIKINMEGNGFVLWKKEDISEFQIHSKFYFYLSFMFWKVNILRVRTVIILSGSIIQTFKTRKRYLCLQSKVRMKAVTRIIQGSLISFLFIFCQFLVTLTIWSKSHLDRWIHFPSAPRKTFECKVYMFLLTGIYQNTVRSNYSFLIWF